MKKNLKKLKNLLSKKQNIKYMEFLVKYVILKNQKENIE